MYLIVLALSLHLLPLHVPKHSERVILIISQTHFSHLNVGEGNGGGVCGSGGRGEGAVACVAGVERGRGRGNLGARESVWGARGGKERNACKDAIVLLKPPLI